MNKLEIKQLSKRIDFLDGFVVSKTEFNENEIIDWIADSVSLFAELDVNSEIISNFLNFFKNDVKEVKGNDAMVMAFIDENTDNLELSPFSTFQLNNIGPFREKITGGEYVLISNPYYRKIAFTAARANLKKKQDDAKLVPTWLIAELSAYNNKYEHVVSSLELIERSYQTKNADGLLKNSRTLLSSILNLDKTLSAKNQDLGPQLQSLIDGNNNFEKLGVSKDFLRGLNNSRIIRNVKVDHKDLPLKYDIPFAVAVSCAYLVIIFLEIIISKGELIK